MSNGFRVIDKTTGETVTAVDIINRYCGIEGQYAKYAKFMIDSDGELWIIWYGEIEDIHTFALSKEFYEVEWL